jgi:hypothetical protein
VNTVGGVAPQTGCSQSTVGTVARVAYTADYYFLADKNDISPRAKATANPAAEPMSSYYRSW